MLVPPGDVPALENALASALTNPELRRDLSKAGSVRAERYSWDNVVDQVLEAYEDAISLGPRVVEGPRVPILGQMRHVARVKESPAAKPREASDRAAS